MKKGRKIFISAFIASGILLAGCNGETIADNTVNAPTNAVIEKEPEEISKQQSTEVNTPTEVPDENKTDEVQFETFAFVQDVMFEFSTGAGGWSTELFIDEEGYFAANYHDSEMGETGENYPNGTIYIANARGRFTDLVKISDDTYSFTLSEITYEKEAGTEEFADDVRYVTTTVYGLETGKKYMLYTKGKDISGLSEDFQHWFIGYLPDGSSILPNFAIHNIEADYGFKGYSFGL